MCMTKFKLCQFLWSPAFGRWSCFFIFSMKENCDDENTLCIWRRCGPYGRDVCGPRGSNFGRPCQLGRATVQCQRHSEPIVWGNVWCPVCRYCRRDLTSLCSVRRKFVRCCRLHGVASTDRMRFGVYLRLSLLSAAPIPARASNRGWRHNPSNTVSAYALYADNRFARELIARKRQE